MKENKIAISLDTVREREREREHNLEKTKEKRKNRRQKRNHISGIGSNNRNINHSSNNKHICSIWKKRIDCKITASKRFS